MESFEEAWGIICSYCKTKITDVAYNTWISRIEPIELDFDKNKAVILVPNDFHRQTITRCYLSLLNEAFEAVFGQIFVIEMKIPEEISVKEEQQAAANAEITDISYEYTFDTFIVGSSNKFAHAACLAVATNPANAYNPLFLYGNSGLGKTHLLYAIDDVQFIGGKESTQEEFFHTFNALYDAHKQIVLTSDRPPKEIKTLDDRLRSRFESDLIADVQPPDVETRIAIIKRKAELLDLDLSNEVCEYIASKIKANIRQLEGTVKKLKAKNLVNQEKITVSSVQEVISDILNNDTPPEVTVERIIEEVSRTFGVTPEAIRSENNRSANISNARHIAIYISRELTTLSMANIGEEFGGRHYSTVIYTVKKVKKMMQNDRKIKEIIDDTIKNIRDR